MPLNEINCKENEINNEFSHLLFSCVVAGFFMIMNLIALPADIAPPAPSLFNDSITEIDSQPECVLVCVSCL